MGRLAEVNQSTVIGLKLFDGATDQFPRARIYNASNTEETGAPFNSPVALTHRANGYYSASFTPNAEGEYFIVYQVYSDAGFTTLNKKYEEVMEILNVRSIDQDLATLITRLTSGRASNLDNLDATISSRAPAATALSTAQWTNTRAANLDNLDASVSSRSTQTSVNNVQTDVTTLLTRLTSGRATNLDNLDATISSRAPAATALSTAQWTNLRAANLDNLDATVSSRLATAGYTAPDNAGISTLLSRLTSQRALNLDNLDALVSSRLASASYTAPDNATIATIDGKLGTPVTSVSADIASVKSDTGTLITRLTSGRAANLDNLDATITSRLAAAAYTAPDNASITAIKAKTDQLAFSGGRVDSVISGAQEDAIVNKVWDEPMADHLTAGTTGKFLSDSGVTANPAAIADAVWDEARSGHVAAGTFGEILDAKISTRASQAAVADVQSTVDSIEAKVDQINIETDPLAIAAAVWSAPRASFVAAGTFGEANQGILSSVRAGYLDNLTMLDVAVSSRASGVQAGDILADTNYLESVLTPTRVAKIDNLDTTISSRASQASVSALPSLSQIVNGVWNEPLAGHLTAGTTGKALQDAGAVADPLAIAAAVWNSVKASYTTPGTFGALLDVAISSRASQASLDDTRGAGFVTGTDSLRQIRSKLDTLPTSAGDATAANQVTILAQLATKASQSSVNTVQSSVSAIPTNPLLTSDVRLNNLDATISSRLSQVGFDVIKGAGFNPATDTLEAIRDAIAVSVDLSPVLNGLAEIKGAGFSTVTDSLRQVRIKTDAAKTSADAAAAEATLAKNAALGAATQAQANTIISGVGAIPTNPALASDPRFANLDATVSSRVATSAFNQILGPTFNPATDNLESIKDSVSAINAGDATAANQNAILNALAVLATQASVNAAISAIGLIPTNPLLTTDPRLNTLDAAISTRATDNDMQLIKGSGFTSVANSLKSITDKIDAANLDIGPVLTELAAIKGMGFVSPVDSLKNANDTAKVERAQIKADTSSLLSSGEGV